MPVLTRKLKKLPEAINISDSDIIIEENELQTQKVTFRQITNFIRNHTVIINAFAQKKEAGQPNGHVPLNESAKVEPNYLTFGKSEGTIYSGANGQIIEDTLSAHKNDKANPHATTKAQVGLGNVPNVSTNNQIPTFTESATLSALTSGETLTIMLGKISKSISSLISHLGNLTNPHKVTKSQVGLGNVTNESKATMFSSPTFTGTPTTPTADEDNSSKQIANTEFVNRAIANGIAASDAMIFKGTIGTGGTVTSLPTTYLTGWTYRVISKGTYAGEVCEIGDLVTALVDRKGSGNLDTDWTICQTNIDGAVIETRKINAGNGLTGGGTLAADRTINVGAGNGIDVSADAISVKPNSAGTSGSVGTIKVDANGVGVNLGNSSTTAFRGDQGKTAYDHSQATHARTDATKTEKSNTNGSIRINGIETQVYQLPEKATFGDGAGFTIEQLSGTYQQKLEVIDNSTVGDAVFKVSQSSDSGTTFDNLFEIRDDKTGYIGSGKIYTTNNKPSKSDIGLSNVPNVTTNNQTPTFTKATVLSELISGETFTLSLGKIAKAITDLIAHIADGIKHITPSERNSWNTVTNKVDKVSGKGLSTNDYTTTEKNKLSGIASGAEANVQSDWNITDTTSDAYIKNKPSSMPASDVKTWAKAETKPSYGWSEIEGKPSTFSPSAHTHAKSQITDMPTKLSQFTNDSGYLTSVDVDTSQNHTHANKSVLDTISQTLIDKWNTDNDIKVTQTNTTGSADYRLVLSGNANDTTETNTARKSVNFTGNPATGEFYAKGYRRIDITGQTLDINTINLASGAPCIMLYIEKTSVGSTNITNIPVVERPFLLDVELIRWASSTDYITRQTFRNAANPANEYVRFCTSGTWSNWVTRVFTDTKYTHPNSDVTAGTYRSVTVNAQGHVTGGTNPTTLAGYGITDAAAKSHTHNYAGSSSAGGVANSATKATQDASGNIIISSYASSASLSNSNLLLKAKSGATLSTVDLSSLSGGNEIISSTEPSSQVANGHWLQPY